MNIHGRAPGIVETRPRATKDPMPRHTATPLLHSQIEDKWLIWGGCAYCIGDMYSSDYEKMVRSHAKNPELIAILTKDIDDWDDSWAKWYATLELVKRRKIVLYDSKAETERAMGVKR